MVERTIFTLSWCYSSEIFHPYIFHRTHKTWHGFFQVLQTRLKMKKDLKLVAIIYKEQDKPQWRKVVWSRWVRDKYTCCINNFQRTETVTVRKFFKLFWTCSTALQVNININNPRISGQYIVINFFFQILYKFWFYFLILSNLDHLRQEENSIKQILLYLKYSKLLFIFIANS